MSMASSQHAASNIIRCVQIIIHSSLEYYQRGTKLQGANKIKWSSQLKMPWFVLNVPHGVLNSLDCSRKPTVYENKLFKTLQDSTPYETMDDFQLAITMDPYFKLN